MIIDLGCVLATSSNFLSIPDLLRLLSAPLNGGVSLATKKEITE